MGLKQKIGGLVSAVAFVATIGAATPVYADRYESPKGNNIYSKENTDFPVLDVKIDKSLPHYLQGVRQISEDVPDYQLHRWLENFRVHTTSMLEHQTGPNWNFVNQSASFTERIHGKDVRFILQDYMIADKVDEGKTKEVLFYNGTGGVKEFPMEEFGKIKKDLIYRITESAVRNMDQFGGIFTEAKSKLAKRLGMSEEDFEKHAEELRTLRGEVEVRNGAFLDYPGKDLEAKDFVINTVILGNHSAQEDSILYAAVVKDTGIMYLTPLSLKLDHIADGLSTTRHEMFHANRKLQNFTLGNMMDVELFAAFPWLDDSVPQLEMYGSYFNAIKWTIKNYMCFDVDQAKSEVMTGLFTVPAFRTDKASLDNFRKYAKWIDSAKITLKKVTRNALVEFYSDPSWYGAFNKKLDYDSAGYDLLMAQQLALTCLGGPEKTLEWIEENRGKIKSIWVEAAEELKKDKAKLKSNTASTEIAKNPILSDIYTNFQAIRNIHGREMAENYLLNNVDKLAPYLGILSEGNLDFLKKNLRSRDAKTQRKVLGGLESMSLKKRLDKIK